jgi:hypothetical protein
MKIGADRINVQSAFSVHDLQLRAASSATMEFPKPASTAYLTAVMMLEDMQYETWW